MQTQRPQVEQDNFRRRSSQVDPVMRPTAFSQGPYLLSVRKAAEYLGRTEKAVRHLYERRILTPLRIDGRVFLDRREIDALFEKARTQAY
jgi:hypothetical protein